jgi:hypothetical protein
MERQERIRGLKAGEPHTTDETEHVFNQLVEYPMLSGEELDRLKSVLIDS